MFDLIQEENRLKIVLDQNPETIEQFRDLHESDRLISVGEYLDSAGFLGNDWYDLEGKIALWSGPAIGQGAIHSEENEDTPDYENIYYYNDYCLKSWVSELLQHGVVYFHRLEEPKRFIVKLFPICQVFSTDGGKTHYENKKDKWGIFDTQKNCFVDINNSGEPHVGYQRKFIAQEIAGQWNDSKLCASLDIDINSLRTVNFM